MGGEEREGGEVGCALAGGCHCGGVRFRLRAPRHLVIWSCNCSICRMKRNDHFVVPKRDFVLESPADLDELGLYRFGSRQALHYFCRTCGICAFYQPRSNPDGWAVTYGCLDKDSRGHDARGAAFRRRKLGGEHPGEQYRGHVESGLKMRNV